MIPRDDTVEKDTPEVTERPPKRVVPPTEAGPLSPAGPTTQAGPLGRVDPVTPAAAGKVVRPPLGLATMTLVVGFAGLIAILLVLGSIAEGVRTQEVFALDTWATPFLHGIASPGLDFVMNRLTDIGSSLVIVPLFVVVVALLLWKHRYGAAVFLGVANGGSLVLNGTMKVLFERPRPQLSYATVLPDYSFPSGHSMNGLVFYVAVALLIWSVFGRRAGLIALVVAAVIDFGVGVSRIYLGYHYFTDVLGGILAGISWLLIVGAAFRARPKWWSWGYRAAPESAPGVAPAAPGPRRPDSPGRTVVR
jgi:membrane-associated phospholipid phosphatase